MQLTGKTPKTGLTPAMRDKKVHEREARVVLEAMDSNPAFAVRTVDGSQWICPYSGALVECPPDSLLPARDFLFQRKPWTARRGAKPNPLYQVLLRKWTHHLTTTGESRLMSFDAAGRWLNPFTASASLLPRSRAATDPAAIAEIAHALASCAAAQATT